MSNPSAQLRLSSVNRSASRVDHGRRTFCIATGLAVAAAGKVSMARNERPLKIVVPYEPGGSADVVARGLAQRITEHTGRTVIIENKGGAGGSIGAAMVARSTPDGDTPLLHTGTLAVEFAAGKSVPYDLRKDFSPVSMIGSGPFALIVTPSLKAQSIQELIALAKGQPGKLNYASSGIGTSVHLAMELFKSMAGVDILHVPYKGSGPSLNALISGEVHMMINPLVTAKSLSTDGRVRAMAVSSLNRTSLWPEIPTLNESGVPDYETGVWYGLSAPGETPKETVAALSSAIQKVIAIQETQEWLKFQGLEPVGNTSQDFDKRLLGEIEIWDNLIRHANLTLY